MPKKDELSQRRYRNLVDYLEGLMRAGLKPEYGGYYGQLILSSDELAELGELDDVRRAAREAGRRLGWKPITKFMGERLFGTQRPAAALQGEPLVLASQGALGSAQHGRYCS
ncbi:hypothetical protein AB0I82_26700 [Streptomyces sp. NPDC050315]|uniref:hypothetical protein n=1 Tax=Streptomyces sp. NPDC050315 TaxID=3155039 RepID=UPI003439F830